MVGAFALTCGGDGAGGGAGSSSEFVSSYCDLLKPCCAMAKLHTDGKQCRAFLGAFAPAMYNAAAGEACLARLRAASAKADYCSGEDWDCEGAFPDQAAGAKKPGEACSDDEECAPSAEGKVKCHRVSSGGAEIRKCQVQVTGKEGDKPCVGTVEGSVTIYQGGGTDVAPKGYLCRVADGLHCDSDTESCVRFKAVGEACMGFDDCGSTGQCESGKCVARKAIGEACTGGFSARGECVEGAFCQESSMTCAAKLGHGTACTDNDQCKSEDCSNGMCKGDVVVDFGLALFCGGN